MKKGFPGLKTYVKTLDDTSSVVFSAANLGVLSLLSLTLTGLVIIIISAIIHNLLPSLSVFLIFFLLLAVLFLPGVFVSLLHLKFLREKNWVKAIHYPLFTFSSGIALNFTFKPLTYILLNFYSNVKSQRFIIIFLSLSFFLGFVGSGGLVLSNIAYFLKDNFFVHGDNKLAARPNLYEDKIAEDDIVISALIPSLKVESPYLEVFVPSFRRERAAREELCGSYQEDESLSEKENAARKDSFNLACMQQFHQFYIDDSLVQALDFLQYRRLEGRQKGIMATLDLQSLSSGKHLLIIKKKYFDEDGSPRRLNIPFIYRK